MSQYPADGTQPAWNTPQDGPPPATPPAPYAGTTPPPFDAVAPSTSGSGYLAPQAYGSGFPVPDPRAPYGIDPVTGIPFSDKSKLAAGLLQIFFGGLGIGRFYLGNVGIAIAQILVTWLTFGIGGLWPVIDGIVLLAGSPRDSQGRPLRS